MASHPGHLVLLARSLRVQLHPDTTVNLWVTVVPARKAVYCIGTPHTTYNTGELSAFYQCSMDTLLPDPATTARRNFNILNDSEYCVRLFADNPVKGRCNEKILRRMRRG